jgi:N-acetylglutamate synthase-like GNAT family acetyltransferase
MIEVKRLESSEYEQLKSIQEGFCPDPKNSIVVVAKSDGQIVGRIFLIRPFHVEGTWIDEPFRRTSLGYRLFIHMERIAKDDGLTKLFSYALNAEIEGYLERLGYKKEAVTVWTKDI